MSGSFETGLFLTGLFLPCVLGCTGPTPFMRGGGQVGTLFVRSVVWNPGHAETGNVSAVADAGEDVLVVGDHGASFFTGDTVTATDRRFTAWRGAAAIPAADRQGTWLAAVDDRGAVHRVHARASLEAISDRYGLSGTPVLALSPLGNGLLAFALPAGSAGLDIGTGPSGAPVNARPASAAPAQQGLLALADGRAVTTFSDGPTGTFAGGGGKAAWIDGAGVRVFDPARKQARFFALPGAARAALDDRGRLVAATSHEVYAEDATGTLTLVYETASPQASIAALAASGGRVWFSEGADLGTIEDRRIAVTTGLAGPPKASLTGSSSGDVWVLTAGALARFAAGAAPPDTAPPSGPANSGPPRSRRDRWTESVAPAFARACASCHGPSPLSGIDLSTFESWERRLSTLRTRVLVTRDMPPANHPMQDSDLRIIDDFTSPAAK